MNEIVSNIHIVLQDAQYDTWDTPLGTTPVVTFEDEAVMGFACVFDTAQALIAQWREIEGTVLAKNAARLRGGGEKSWNVYCVFATRGKASYAERQQLRLIEDNLERTRKIVAVGLLTREDVTTALLPLLPILSKPMLSNEDITKRLQRRIAAIAPGAESVALDASVEVAEVVRLLAGVR